MKKTKKILLVVLALMVLMTTYNFLVVSVTALSYKGVDVGVLRGGEGFSNDFNKIKIGVNAKIADENISANDVEVRQEYVFAKTSLPPEEVKENILSVEATDKTHGYGVCYPTKTEVKYCFTSKSRAECLTYYNNLISQFRFYGISFPESPKIIEVTDCYFNEKISLSFGEIIKDMGLHLTKTFSSEDREEVKLDSIYVFHPDLEEERILKNGYNKVVLVKKCFTYENGEIVSKETEESIIESGTPDIVETSDKTKISGYYSEEIIDFIPNLTPEKKEFLKSILPAAVKGFEESGVPIPVTLAQAIIESGWGRHHIENNIYGFKSYNETDSRVLKQTHEFVDGKYITVDCYFKTYPSFGDSVADYVRLISSGKRYEKVLAANDYVEAAIAMGESGYATCPIYGEKILKTIDAYCLYYFA